MGKFDCKGLLEFQKQLEKLQKTRDTFIESCAKELAARLLRMVVERTPVGEYSGGEYQCKVRKGDKPTHISAEVEGKNGSKLRKGWTMGEIRKDGNAYKIDIINPVEYAPYVEYGHVQKPGRYVPALGMKLKKGWVKGHFMMTISEQELEKIAPKVLEAKIKKYLEGAFS